MGKEEQSFSDHDVLMELKNDLKWLVCEWKKVSNGQGFPRCAARGVQIENLVKTTRWLRNTFVGTGLVTLLGGLFVLIFR